MNSESIPLNNFSLQNSLPDQCSQGTWLGRAWLPAEFSCLGLAGPHLMTVQDGQVFDLGKEISSVTQVLEHTAPVELIKSASRHAVCTLDELLDNSFFQNTRELSAPCLLSPVDVQAVKACGVTFVASLMERIIEEKAFGDPAKADEIRQIIHDHLGGNLREISPGSPEIQPLKEKLVELGIWSGYLEVGIGPDPEVFTKCQPLSSIGHGAELGVLATSQWNNPEPEVAILVTPDGKIIGATLGNDVNLRDYEGRSALLLGKAKDQNGSCPVGPLIRLFDESFSLDDVRDAEISLAITGNDGFTCSAVSKMNEISRDPEEIMTHILNSSHQYPDGLLVFLGTMFAPTDDRDEAGLGFSHKPGDRVDISTPKLGRLTNWVNHCDKIPPWVYGISEWTRFQIAANRLRK